MEEMDEKQQYEYKKEAKVSLPNDDFFQVPVRQVRCPSCLSEIPVADINIQEKVAKCTSCNGLFSVKPIIEDLTEKPSMHQEVIRPEGIEIFKFQDELDISVRQPFLVGEMMAVAFIPIFTLMFTIAYITGKFDATAMIVSWSLLAIALINLVLRKKHKIHINVDSRNLSIVWKPRKFMKTRVIPVGEIDQLYVATASGMSSIFIVVNGVEGQRHMKILSGLRGVSRAKYLEQEIEKHLGIKNRKVPEER